jgi:hypothetical protein
MKYGDIINFKPIGLISKLISIVDGSPYSHTAIFLEERHGVKLFIESHESKGGVVICKLEDWKNYDVFRPKIKPRPKREVLSVVGRQYDYGRLITVFKSKIFKYKTQNNDDTKLICSELADYVYKYRLGQGKILTPALIHKLYLAGLLDKVV